MSKTRQQCLLEDTHFRVLSLLEDNTYLNQREMAVSLGMSLGAVNYCLRALAVKGLVKIYNFHGSKNKLGYAYLLTQAGFSEKLALTSQFLQRKKQEYAALEAEIKALQRKLDIKNDVDKLL